ncbi:hypothetical protein JZ751_008547 [Albula glossodonta]|uniref:Uncharacterized protein n=1 Tax=Albula glossodonta TaxID=121402 RepID=A0A8T2N8T0_9TELE|nr:hypothetical protein JZ751_008547 [Albula glossodonta]
MRSPVPPNLTMRSPVPPNLTLLTPVPPNLTMRSPVPPNLTMRSPVPPNLTLLTPVPPNVTMRSPVPPNLTMRSPVPPNLTMRSPVPPTSPCAALYPQTSPCAALYPQTSPCTALYPQTSPCAALYPHTSPCAALYPKPHSVHPCALKPHPVPLIINSEHVVPPGVQGGSTPSVLMLFALPLPLQPPGPTACTVARPQLYPRRAATAKHSGKGGWGQVTQLSESWGLLLTASCFLPERRGKGETKQTKQRAETGLQPCQQTQASSHASPVCPCVTFPYPPYRSARQSPQNLRKSLEPPAPQPGDKAPSPGSQTDSQEVGTDSGHASSAGAEPRERAGRSGKGILRSASGRADSTPRGGAGSGLGAGRPALRKAESTRVKGSASQLRPSLSSQSRAVSVSERLDSTLSGRGGGTSTLPRASSVISTAEGSTRRTSIHDCMAKDGRAPVSVDPTPSEYPCTPPATPLPKSASLPPPGPRTPALFSPSFTVDSLFTDTIFSEAGKPHPFLSLNTSLVSSISGPLPNPAPLTCTPGQPQPQVSSPNHPNHRSPDHKPNGDLTTPDHVTPDGQSLGLSPEEKQSLWYEYGCV